VPGSSNYLDRVLVCYSNEAKMELLGVPKAVLERHGAVSSEVAAAMARGGRERSRTDVGLSVTGIAGPGGATAQKPVGLVYVGLDARGTGLLAREFRFHGPRDAIKMRAAQAALNLVRQWLPIVRPGRS
jgi:nicotinamide-nucleotide amidase